MNQWERRIKDVQAEQAARWEQVDICELFRHDKGEIDTLVPMTDTEYNDLIQFKRAP